MIDQLIEEACLKCEQLLHEGSYESAEMIARQAKKVKDVLNLDYVLALSLGFQGKTDEAIAILSGCPLNHKTHNNLGLVYAHDLERAEYHFSQACLLTDESTPRTNLALTYSQMADYELAEDHFKKVLDCPHGRFNYGAFLYSRKRFNEALIQYEKTNLCIAKYNLGACKMMLGNPDWRLFEERFKAFPRLGRFRDQFGLPYWDGSNKKVLFFNEQGLGDFIQYSRYLPEDCYVTVEPILESLLPAMGLKPWKGEKVDCCCSMMSLPGMVKERKITIDVNEKFEQYPQLKIGLCWSGSPVHPNDHNRSIYLREFDVLSGMPGTKWFALSVSGMRKNKMGLVDYERGAEGRFVKIDIKDVLHLAKIIQAMDLIVTVDTLVAHLAGTLGKKTWLLVPWVPDWRWGIAGSSSSLYPTIKLVRQTREKDWSTELLQIHKGIHETRRIRTIGKQ